MTDLKKATLEWEPLANPGLRAPRWAREPFTL